MNSNALSSIMALALYGVFMLFIGVPIGYQLKNTRVPENIQIAQDAMHRSNRLMVQCNLDMMRYSDTLDSIHTWLHRGTSAEELIVALETEDHE